MGMAEIRAGLVDNITSNIPGVSMTGYLMTPPEPPCFEIDFGENSLVYDATFRRGTDELDLIVRGIVAGGDVDEGQVLLDTWIDGVGMFSVKEAIESDKKLGGAVDDLRVTQVTGHRRLLPPEMPNAVFLCVEWAVHLIVSP